jgi:hypothetical protein
MSGLTASNLPVVCGVGEGTCTRNARKGQYNIDTDMLQLEYNIDTDMLQLEYNIDTDMLQL